MEPPPPAHLRRHQACEPGARCRDALARTYVSVRPLLAGSSVVKRMMRGSAAHPQPNPTQLPRAPRTRVSADSHARYGCRENTPLLPCLFARARVRVARRLPRAPLVQKVLDSRGTSAAACFINSTGTRKGLLDFMIRGDARRPGGLKHAENARLGSWNRPFY